MFFSTHFKKILRQRLNMLDYHIAARVLLEVLCVLRNLTEVGGHLG